MSNLNKESKKHPETEPGRWEMNKSVKYVQELNEGGKGSILVFLKLSTINGRNS